METMNLTTGITNTCISLKMAELLIMLSFLQLLLVSQLKFKCNHIRNVFTKTDKVTQDPVNKISTDNFSIEKHIKVIKKVNNNNKYNRNLYFNFNFVYYCTKYFENVYLSNCLYILGVYTVP